MTRKKDAQHEGVNAVSSGDIRAKPRKIKNSVYEKELARLQIELVKLQEWIKHEGLRVVVLFEGRDAAGNGAKKLPGARSRAPRTDSFSTVFRSAHRRDSALGCRGVLRSLFTAKTQPCLGRERLN